MVFSVSMISPQCVSAKRCKKITYDDISGQTAWVLGETSLKTTSFVSRMTPYDDNTLLVLASLFKPVLQFFSGDAYCSAKFLHRQLLFPDQFIDFGSPQVQC